MRRYRHRKRPYLIYTEADFKNIPQKEYHCFKQMSNIKLYEKGYSIVKFIGIYDGHNKTIITHQLQATPSGIFCSIQSYAIIKNLNVDIKITREWRQALGSILGTDGGYSIGGHSYIENCTVTDEITTPNRVGSIVGISTPYCHIIDC